MNCNFKKVKGFTLIELLVVVSIISLMSSVVMTNVKITKERSQGTAFRQSTDEITKAIELYRANNNGNLPPSGGVDQYYAKAFDGTEYNPVFKTSIYPYLKKIPKPPFMAGQANNGVFFYFMKPVTAWCDGKTSTPEYIVVIRGIQYADFFSDWNNFHWFGTTLPSDEWFCFSSE